MVAKNDMKLAYRKSSEHGSDYVFGKSGHGIAITAGRSSCTTSSTSTVVPVLV